MLRLEMNHFNKSVFSCDNLFSRSFTRSLAIKVNEKRSCLQTCANSTFLGANYLLLWRSFEYGIICSNSVKKCILRPSFQRIGKPHFLSVTVLFSFPQHVILLRLSKKG